MKTKVHKVTLYIVDHDQLGHEGVVETIESTRYPNRCISPHVVDIETKEVEWSDDHPLNQTATCQIAFDELFECPAECARCGEGCLWGC